jgi:vanillate O-demethylase monooxygenase subunit
LSVIDHWHPICRVSEVARGPVGVVIDGHPIAIFRSESGQLGVLEDSCPHRRMRLSRGKVCGERLFCCYHGWQFDTQGRGESPGTPKLHARAGCYEGREAHGWVWARRAGANTPFPMFDTEGFKLIGDFVYSFDHPLELVVDNFTEAEHTGAVHEFFGYSIERLHEVLCEATATEDTVTVWNYGPHKPMNWIHRLLMGIKSNYHLIDDWTTFFAPLYCIYNYHYDDPVTHQKGRLHQRSVFFFVPEGPSRTRVVVLLYLKYRIHIGRRFVWLFYPLLRRRFHYEVMLDKQLLDGLTDKNPLLQGMKLSRFDKVLALNRERIDRIYRGQDPGRNGKQLSLRT